MTHHLLLRLVPKKDDYGSHLGRVRPKHGMSAQDITFLRQELQQNVPCVFFDTEHIYDERTRSLFLDPFLETRDQISNRVLKADNGYGNNDDVQVVLHDEGFQI